MDVFHTFMNSFIVGLSNFTYQQTFTRLFRFYSDNSCVTHMIHPNGMSIIEITGKFVLHDICV